MNWYIEVLKKYAVFDGRASRKEYWMFFLFNFIIWFILGFIGGLLRIESFISIISIIYSLAVFIPSIAVGVRRMHDIGRSGWWIICPVVNIVFACFDSQPGNNEYGPSPKMA